MANISIQNSNSQGNQLLPLTMRQRILLVMSRLDAKPLYDHFIRLDYSVEQTDSGLYALTMLEHNPPSIVVCQKQTQDLSGWEISELVDHDPMLANIILIVIHNYNKNDAVDNYQKREKTIFLREDSSLMTVSQTVSRLLAQSIEPYSLNKPSPSMLSNVKPKIPVEGLLTPPQTTPQTTQSQPSNKAPKTTKKHSNPPSAVKPLLEEPPLLVSTSSQKPPSAPTSEKEVKKTGTKRAPRQRIPNAYIERFDISRAQIRGKLQSISLFDLLNTLTSNCKTGRLCVRTEDTDGFVHLRNGVILHVIYANKLAEAALEQLLIDTLNEDNTPFFFGDVRFIHYDTALAERLWDSAAISSQTDALLRNLALKLFERLPKPRTT